MGRGWRGGPKGVSQSMLAQGSPGALAAAAVHLASAGPCCACAGYAGGRADLGVAMGDVDGEGGDDDDDADDADGGRGSMLTANAWRRTDDVGELIGLAA